MATATFESACASLGNLDSCRRRTAIGLMSGTSLDGIDVAVVVTDGITVFAHGPALTEPYPEAFRRRLRACLGRRPSTAWRHLIADLTDRHADAVRAVLRQGGLKGADVDVIGFHGQTVWHRPEARETIQIGDGAKLADSIGIPVVTDFRTADVAAGGEGAPLVPLYHQALAAGLDRPVAILNLGGVANVSWIGTDANGTPPVVAFDTGPGNALLDDWVNRTAGVPYDEGGVLAAKGIADRRLVAAWLDHPFFRRRPPKSIDRDAFAGVLADLGDMSAADGAATLALFTAEAVAMGVCLLPTPPRRWLVTGGGRRNPVLLARLSEAVGAPVTTVEEVGWRGDVLEAEAFAFLAVRSLMGLPLSLPSTTGVPAPMPGGRLFRPQITPTRLRSR